MPTIVLSGMDNSITSTTALAGCLIGAGQSNTIEGDITNCIIGGGYNNVINGPNNDSYWQK